MKLNNFWKYQEPGGIAQWMSSSNFEKSASISSVPTLVSARWETGHHHLGLHRPISAKIWQPLYAEKDVFNKVKWKLSSQVGVLWCDRNCCLHLHSLCLNHTKLHWWECIILSRNRGVKASPEWWHGESVYWHTRVSGSQPHGQRLGEMGVG